MQGTVEERRMQRILGRARSDALGKRDPACRNPFCRRKLADGTERFAIAKTKVAHVAIERVDIDGLQPIRGVTVFVFEGRSRKGRFGPFSAHRTNHMKRPRRSLVEAALDRESPIRRFVRNLQLNSSGGVRQNERFADLKIFDDKRPPFEELHAGFEGELNKSCGRKNNVALYLVILEESHVPAIQPGGPGRGGAGEASVKHTAAARPETTFAPIGGFIPPAASIPRVRGE